MLLAATLLALAGCKLIDQRTFQRKAIAPAASQLSRPDLPALPLLIVSFAIADADWRTPLHAAVRGAEAHKPDVVFPVVTAGPTASKREAQDTYITQAQEDAALVVNELQASGVPPERIVLRMRGDPGNPPREVRIYTQ